MITFYSSSDINNNCVLERYTDLNCEHFTIGTERF